MRTALILSALLVAGVARAQFTQGSNFCEDEQNRLDNCKPLVSCPNHGGGGSSQSGGSSDSSSTSSSSETSSEVGSGSGSGSGEVEVSGSGSGEVEVSGSGSGSVWLPGEYCFLLEFFLEFEVQFTGEIQIDFLTWINDTQINIVEDSSLTEYEILVQIWYSLQILFEQYSEIESVLLYAYIPEWGYTFQLEGLAIDIQSEFTEITVEDLITVDASGSCPLFEALLNATSGNSAESSACEQLISQLELIINGSYSFDVELVLIYEQISAFFVQYPQFQADFFAIQIPGFGCFESFFDICTTYWDIDNFSIVVGGSASGCELVSSLTALYENTSSGLSVSERSDIKQLANSLETYYESETNIQLRVEFFATTLYQFFLLENWTVEVILSVELQGYGTIYDFLYAYIYEQNHGLTLGDFTTPAPSTTTAETTTAETTTPVPNGDCSTVGSVNVFSANTTLLITSITEAQSNWTAGQKTQFKGYLIRIYNISANSTLSVSSKFTQIQTILTGWTSSSSTIYVTVQNIFIQTWGLVSQYCGCPAPTTA